MFNKRNVFIQGKRRPNKKIKLSFSDDELETEQGSQSQETDDQPSSVKLADMDKVDENDFEQQISFKPLDNKIKFKKKVRRNIVVESKKGGVRAVPSTGSDRNDEIRNSEIRNEKMGNGEMRYRMKYDIEHDIQHGNSNLNPSLSELAFQEKLDLARQYADNKDNDSVTHTHSSGDDADDMEIDRDWYMQDEMPSHTYFNQYDMDEEFENSNEPAMQNDRVHSNDDQYDEVNDSLDIFVHRLIPPFLDESTILSKNQQLINIIKDKSGDLYKYSKNGSTLVNERRKLNDRKNNSIDRVNNKNTAISKIIKDKGDAATKNNNNESNIVDGDGDGDVDEDPNDLEKVKNQRKSLPAYKIKNELVKIINENQVIIIVGETGSGKTTQLPQFLFEEGYHNHGLIGITQPRRVAAISVAKRVSDEMNVKIGDEVGYSIRFEDRTTPKTRIKFMTDGILLRETLLDNELNKYSCIIMDEAHERSLNTDILFGIFKKILVRRRDLKLIITSATMNSLKFSKFFGNAIQFSIPGKTFPVDILFQSIPSIDYVDSSIKQILKLHLSNTPGDILVFMTGQEDIETTCELLGDELNKLTKIDKSIKHLEILPIYSTLSSDLQSKIFKKNLFRKCIIATNIAETSLTIDGIKFVIDTGLMKIKFYNPKLNMDSLQIAPISLAQANQRSGRAGRTGPGKCFRLYTLSSSIDEMFKEPIPEIQRTNLNNTILLLKSLNIENLNKFPFLDKPSIESINTAQYNLWSIGALDNFGNLTNLGKKMAKFPIDPTLSKLLIISTLNNFRCSKEILIIVSMLSIPPIFIRPMNDKNLQKKSDQTREKFQIPESDHLTLLNIFTQFLKNNKNEKWCTQNFLHYKSLRRAIEIFNQLNIILKSSNLKIESNDDWDKIRECICCSFFQNAAEFKKYGEYQQLRSGLLMFLHPTSSLYGMGDLPKFIVYHELLMTGQKQYMNYVTSVEGKWLVDYGNVFYSKRIKNITSKENQLLKQKKFNELIESQKKNL